MLDLGAMRRRNHEATYPRGDLVAMLKELLEREGDPDTKAKVQEFLEIEDSVRNGWVD